MDGTRPNMVCWLWYLRMMLSGRCVVEFSELTPPQPFGQCLKLLLYCRGPGQLTRAAFLWLPLQVVFLYDSQAYCRDDVAVLHRFRSTPQVVWLACLCPIPCLDLALYASARIRSQVTAVGHDCAGCVDSPAPYVRLHAGLCPLAALSDLCREALVLQLHRLLIFWYLLQCVLGHGALRRLRFAVLVPCTVYVYLPLCFCCSRICCGDLSHSAYGLLASTGKAALLPLSFWY